MMLFRQSIGFRLLGMTIILLAIPLLVDSFIFLEKRFDKATKRAKSLLLQQADFHTLPISHIQSSDQEIFRTLVYFLQLQQKFPNQKNVLLSHTIKQLKLADAHDQILCAALSQDGKYTIVASSTDYFDAEAVNFFMATINPFSVAAKANHSVTDLVIDPKTGHPLFVTAHSVLSEKGEPLGVIAIIDDLQTGGIDQLLSPVQQGYEIKFAFLLPSKAIFAASDHALRFQYLAPLTDAQKMQLRSLAKNSGNIVEDAPLEISAVHERPYIEFIWQGKKYLGATQPIPGTELSLLAYASTRSIFMEVIFEYILIYSTYLGIFLIGFIFSYVATRRLSRPINKLGAVMLRIEEGDLEARYHEDRLGFEINKLGEIFNRTIESLLENERIAEEERIKKEILSQELELGRQVQHQLLPLVVPPYEGCDVSYAFLPAIEVAGDFFDVYTKENDKLILTVADASGKGVQACLYSLTLKNMLKIMVSSESDIYEATRKANNLFCEDVGDTGMFVTAFMAQYDHHSRRLEFVCCGHNPAFVYKNKSKTVERLEATGVAIGFLLNQEKKKPPFVFLEDGDVLVIYSDGITEAHDIHGEMFGEERLIRYLQLEAHQSAEVFKNGLMEELHIFGKGAKQHDDITLVVMKVRAS